MNLTILVISLGTKNSSAFDPTSNLRAKLGQRCANEDFKNAEKIEKPDRSLELSNL